MVTGATIFCKVGPGDRGPVVSEVLDIDQSEVAGTVTGVVTRFLDDRGYGFISPDSGEQDIFVHVTALDRSGVSDLREGQHVTAYVVRTKRGWEVEHLALLENPAGNEQSAVIDHNGVASDLKPGSQPDAAAPSFGAETTDNPVRAGHPQRTPNAPVAAEQKRPLTLRSGATLGLRRPVETGVVRQSFSTGLSKQVPVEVRKKRLIQPAEEVLRQAALATLADDAETAPQPVDEKHVAERPLPAPEMRPKAIAGVPSVFGYAWSAQNTIILTTSSANFPRFPFPSSNQDHARRVEACRTLSEDLVTDLEDRENVRKDYTLELKKYADRLPFHGKDGNILLSDAAARTLRDMFHAEAEILPTWFAARLKTLLEQHIGLRPYYQEIEIFYRDVRSGRLQEPLPLDAFTDVIHGVQAHTPGIFDPSVAAGVDESKQLSPILPHAETPSVDPNQPVPPPDPLGELDPTKAHDYQAAGMVNKLWQVFTAGETVHKAAGGWRAAYDTLAPPVGRILDWLRQIAGSGP